MPVLQPAAVEQDAVDAEVLEGQRTVGDIEPAHQLQGLLGFVQPVAQLSRGAHGRADGQVDARARPDVLGGGMDPVEQVRRDVQVSGQDGAREPGLPGAFGQEGRAVQHGHRLAGAGATGDLGRPGVAHAVDDLVLARMQERAPRGRHGMHPPGQPGRSPGIPDPG